MRLPWKFLLAAAVACGVALGSPTAKEAPPSQSVTGVGDVLPKVDAPKALAVAERALEASLVFLDPATGEMRAPEAGEHDALTGGPVRTARTAAAAEPEAVSLPGGGLALAAGASPLEFATVVRGTDGSVSFQCAVPGHRHQAGAKGGSHAR